MISLSFGVELAKDQIDLRSGLQWRAGMSGHLGRLDLENLHSLVVLSQRSQLSDWPLPKVALRTPFVSIMVERHLNSMDKEEEVGDLMVMKFGLDIGFERSN